MSKARRANLARAVGRFLLNEVRSANLNADPGPSEAPGGEKTTTRWDPGETPGRWTSIDVDPGETPGRWTSIDVDLRKTPGRWTSIDVDPGETPGRWTSIGVDLRKTPGLWTSIGVDLGETPGPWTSIGVDPGATPGAWTSIGEDPGETPSPWTSIRVDPGETPGPWTSIGVDPGKTPGRWTSTGVDPGRWHVDGRCGRRASPKPAWVAISRPAPLAACSAGHARTAKAQRPVSRSSPASWLSAGQNAEVHHELPYVLPNVAGTLSLPTTHGTPRPNALFPGLEQSA